MPIKYCQFCGIKFARRKGGSNDILRYCSVKCANNDRFTYKAGTLRVLNDRNVALFTISFTSREELKELLELYSVAPAVSVLFKSNRE